MVRVSNITSIIYPEHQRTRFVYIHGYLSCLTKHLMITLIVRTYTVKAVGTAICESNDTDLHLSWKIGSSEHSLVPTVSAPITDGCEANTSACSSHRNCCPRLSSSAAHVAMEDSKKPPHSVPPNNLMSRSQIFNGGVIKFLPDLGLKILANQGLAWYWSDYSNTIFEDVWFPI